ncbi:unnamed protein product, partial [Effrenium voratum]
MAHARALSHEPSPASARADASARAQLSTSAQSARSGGSKAQRGSRRAELISKLKAGPNLAKAEGTQRGALKRLKGLKLRRKADTNLEDALQLEIDDVAESLGLTADPKVLEIGDEKLLKLKKSGKLNPQDDSIISAFKKHKATIGKALFEAENANNLGVEMYLLGDYHTAAGYFDQALQLTSEKKKSASAELAVLKAFVAEKYGGSEELLYTDLVKGEWRSALGHNKFVEALLRLEYSGDPDRVFSMLDSVANDGKVSLPELTSTLKAKKTRLNNMDREPPQKGVVLSNLGCCLLQRGDLMSALQRLRDALRILRRNANESDERVMTAMTNMCVAYMQLGDTDAALQQLSVLLEKREAQGHLHDDVLNVLYLTGFCFLVKANRFQIRQMDKKQENPVEANYRFALCSFKERLLRQQAVLSTMPEIDSMACDVGARHQLELQVARSHEVIAEIHDKCEDLQRAREHLLASLQYKKQILDPADPDLFSTLNIFASVCARAGSNAEALEAMELAMKATEELFGFKSAAVATQLFHSSLIFLRTAQEQKDARGMFEEATERLQQCVTIRTELFGQESQEVATAAQLLGSVCFVSGDRQGARRNFANALLARLASDPGSPEVACSAHALGCLYARMPHRHEESVLLLGKAAAIRRDHLGEDSIHFAETLHELASVMMCQQNAHTGPQALVYLSQAAAIREEKLGKRTLAYAASLHQLGQAHLHMGMASEAKLYLQAALSLREQLGKRSAQAAASKAALGVACANNGELEKAFKLLKAAYKDRERIFGQQHALTADALHQIGLVMVRQQREQAIAPLLQALKIHTQLNAEDVAARLDDSDEDPVDLKGKKSERTRRIQSRARKGGAARGLTEVAEVAEEAVDVAGESEADAEDAPDVGDVGEAKGDAKEAKLSFARSLFTKLKSKIKMPTEKKEDASREEEDSEICIEDVGVDIRGCFAPRLATSMQTLADIYAERGDLSQAKYWLDRSACIRDELFGPASQEFGEAMHHFGLLNRRAGFPRKALAYFRKALHAREKSAGFAHKDTADTCDQMAQVLQELGKPEEAGIFMSKALAIQEATSSTSSMKKKDLEQVKERMSTLAASGMEYDPVRMGETMPHISRRSAESYLHGWKDRTQQFSLQINH